METPSVVSPQVLTASVFYNRLFLFIDFFLFMRVKIHTRSACSGVSVQKSFIIGLNVEKRPSDAETKA